MASPYCVGGIPKVSGKLPVVETSTLTFKYLPIIITSHVANRTICQLNRLKNQELETPIDAGLVGTNQINRASHMLR